MRSRRLAATALVSLVVGTVLAVLAPAAAADTDSDTAASPGNRGWVAANRTDDD
jgi:hypothetical protein